MDDLERISVGVAYIGGIVSRIVFQSCAGRNVVHGTSGHCGLIEFIDLIFVFGREAPVNGCWIRIPLLYPEERLLAVTKSPQIGMTVFALVRHEEFDIKRLQGRLIESQRTFDIVDSQNNVVEHRPPPLSHERFIAPRAWSALAARMKSFSERPPIEWVQRVNFTRPQPSSMSG